MKKFFLFCSFFCSFFSINAQQINWIQEHPYRHDNINNHFGNVISSDKEGNIYCSSLLRVHYNDTNNPSGSYLRKYNQKGELLWEKFYKITDILGLVTDNEGNSYLAGRHAFDLNFGCGEMNAPNSNPAFLAKLDSNGNCVWSKEVTKPANTNYDEPWFSKLVLDKSEKFFYVIGKNTPKNYKECFPYLEQGAQIICKYDRNGNCIWTNTILGVGHIGNLAVNENYLVITGTIRSDLGFFGTDSSAFSIGVPDNYFRKIYTAAYNLGGNFLWARPSVIHGNEGNSVTIDKENNIYITGFLESGEVEGRNIGADYHNGFAVKYNEQGDTLAVTPLLGPNFEEGRAIFAAEDGVFWSGTFYNELNIADTAIFTGKSGSFLAKMSVDLRKVIWIKILSGGGHTEIFKIDEDKQGNLIACGSYEGFLEVDGWRFVNNGYKTPFVLSLKDTTPAPITTYVLEKETGTNFNIFPNPTRNSINIHYQSKKNSPIILKVRNLTGAIIHEVYDPNLTGTFQKQIKIGGNVPGLYFVELKTEGEWLIKKVIINN